MAESHSPSNTHVLWVVLLLNIGITSTQAVAAWYSNSLALLMDDIQMGIDTLTCKKSDAVAKRAMLTHPAPRQRPPRYPPPPYQTP
jgi:Co/Zn/Cd efflux system component